jgi:RNA polymerase sigma factor (sigma-70 family)
MTAGKKAYANAFAAPLSGWNDYHSPGDPMSLSSVRGYHRAAVGDDPSSPADAELLARFAACRDEAAFELLVWRHAALVQRVCRNVLRDHHAAEDAAQATFLVLARKAHTFAGRGSVVGWLYCISRRTALRLARQRARREASALDLDRLPAIQREAGAAPDEAAALCAEVDRLPERYRVPVLLCFFEGLTQAEAARRTGWAIGTVSGRLARAKVLLARRLSRKGIGAASMALAMPAGGFVGATAQAATAFAGRRAVVPGVPTTVINLAEGVLKAMTAAKLKFAAIAALVCFAGTTVWGLSASAQPQQPVHEPLPTGAQLKPGEDQPAPVKQPPRVDRSITRAQLALTQNKLKQILLAFHNYNDVNRHLPTDIVDKNGRPLLSWRVAILPYLEQQNLYNQFKLDEPWDSDHNKALMEAHIPKIYQSAFEPAGTTKTHFKVFAGPGTPFEPGKKTTFTDITDGTSNTLGVVEAGPPAEWTKPSDIEYDPKKPFPKVTWPYKNAVNAAFLDGSVMALSPGIEEKTWRNLVERADGNLIAKNQLPMASLPLTKDEIELNQVMLQRNKNLLKSISEQLEEQNKLLYEIWKMDKPPQDLKMQIPLTELNQGLEELLKQMKKDTEQLKSQLKK